MLLVSTAVTPAGMSSMPPTFERGPREEYVRGDLKDRILDLMKLINAHV